MHQKPEKTMQNCEIKDKKKECKNKKTPVLLGLGGCDRGRIRTFDRLLRRQMLYPAELRDLVLRSEAACPP